MLDSGERLAERTRSAASASKKVAIIPRSFIIRACGSAGPEGAGASLA